MSVLPLVLWTCRLSVALEPARPLARVAVAVRVTGEPELGLDTRHAVDLIIDLLLDSDDPITLVPTGPLTNIGVLLTMRPDLAPKIGELVIMGGGFSGGNASKHAELNIWVDPHAAHAVFASGVPIVLAPLDITRPLKVPPAVTAALAQSKARTAHLVSIVTSAAGSPARRDTSPSW